MEAKSSSPSTCGGGLFTSVEPGGFHQNGVGGGFERRNGALSFVLVAPALVLQHLLQGNVQALLRQLGMPAAGARLVVGGQEEFHPRVGKDHGADVASLEDG